MQENQRNGESHEQITANLDVRELYRHSGSQGLTSIISTSSASFLVLGFFFRSFLSRIARL
jgi:hypothetical protein